MSGATSYSDDTCSTCWKNDGCCLVGGSDCGLGSDSALKSGYRQFYDCTSGGDTEDGMQMCQLSKNHAYYAVIVVPVLAFSFIIMGLLYVFRAKLFKGYSAPPENKEPDTA